MGVSIGAVVSYGIRRDGLGQVKRAEFRISSKILSSIFEPIAFHSLRSGWSLFLSDFLRRAMDVALFDLPWIVSGLFLFDLLAAVAEGVVVHPQDAGRLALDSSCELHGLIEVVLLDGFQKVGVVNALRRKSR